MKEVLIGVDINFSNGSSGHTATTTSVLNAVNISGGSLGSLFGSLGSRVNFSISSINDVMKNFIMIEETYSTDSTKRTVTRQYQDRTSLLLKSNFIAVRGKDVAPNGELSFSGYVPFWGECAGSESRIKFSNKGPSKNGAAIIIGSIYNEISEIIEETKQRVSLIYQGGNLIPELSYNSEIVSSWYKRNPDLNSSVLKYGYTLSELKSALNSAGIIINGLPDRNDILFDWSGTLESVISSVASTFGMYWYIDPNDSTVKLISSTLASNAGLRPASGNIISSSYSTSALNPTIATSYISKIAPKKFEYEYPDKQRILRFKLVDVLGEIKLDIKREGFELFYGPYAASQFNSTSFDAIALHELLVKKTEASKLFADYYSPSFTDKQKEGFKKFNDIYPWSGARKAAKAAFQGKFNLEKASFLEIGKNTLPSSSSAFELIKSCFDTLDNTVYISNRYSEFKAVRMSCSSNEGNISGPFFEGEELSNVEGLQSLASLFKILGKDDITLQDLAKVSKSSGAGDHHFILSKPYGNSETDDNDTVSEYKIFDEENFIIYETPYGITYAGYSRKLINLIETLKSASKNIFKGRLKDNKKSSSLKGTYTRTRRPTTDPKNAEAQKREDDRKAALDSWGERTTELLDKVEFVVADTRLNGASGDPLNPVDFQVKTGSVAEMQALKSNSFAAKSSRGRSQKSSSETVLGISVPSFDITLSSLQLRVDGQGVTTTISRSTMPLLPMDETIIIADGMAKITRDKAAQLSARQKNSLNI